MLIYRRNLQLYKMNSNLSLKLPLTTIKYKSNNYITNNEKQYFNLFMLILLNNSNNYIRKFILIVNLINKNINFSFNLT